MRRREFIARLGGAVAWPLVARAQQSERMQRIGILMNVDDADNRASYAAFVEALQRLGWTDWPQRANRVSLGDQRFAESGDRISGIVSRGYPSQLHSRGKLLATGDPNNTCRIYAGRRSGQCRHCRQSGEAWGQRDWIHGFRLRNCRKVARTAQGDCSQRDACRGHQRSHHHCKYRPARRDSVRCAIVEGGGDPGRWARRQGHRAHRYRICARIKLRADRSGKPDALRATFALHHGIIPSRLTT